MVDFFPPKKIELKCTSLDNLQVQWDFTIPSTGNAGVTTPRPGEPGKAPKRGRMDTA